MKLPPYGDRPGLMQALVDIAALNAAAQQTPPVRRTTSLVMKRFILTKPTERQFVDATRGLVLTPEILYTLTLYKPSGKK